MLYWYFILLTKRITVVLQIGFELFHNVLYGTAINFGSYYIRVFGWLWRLENMMRVRGRFCFLTFCHNKISLRSSKNPAIHQKFQNDILRCNMNMDAPSYSKLLVFIVQFFILPRTTIEKKYQSIKEWVIHCYPWLIFDFQGQI